MNSTHTRTIECRRTECDGALVVLPADPCLPSTVTHFECDACDEWYLRDDETGEIEVDA